MEHAGTASLKEQLAELAGVLRSGSPAPAGRLLGLPELPGDGLWVDIAGAAAVAGVAPKTITSWLARRAPKRRPFPAAHRLLYRLYWPLAAVQEWRDAHDQAAAGEAKNGD